MLMMMLKRPCVLLALSLSWAAGFLERQGSEVVPPQLFSTTTDGMVAPPLLFTTPPKQLTNCNDSTSEIVFVLDSSGSVGLANFIIMKTFVKTVIQNLDIGPDKTRVGLITFSRYPTIRLHLDDFDDKAELLNAIDNVPYISGLTETQSAIYLLLQEGFYGSRPSSAHIGIVITDGRSFHEDQTAAAAESAQQAGIVMFAIGIGNEINLNELNALATDPNVEHVYTVTNFDSLINIVGTLTERSCAVLPGGNVSLPSHVNTTAAPLPINTTDVTSGECNQTLADVLFILDSSGSLGMDNFNAIKLFVINIVNFLDIGENLTKVGVITFSNYPARRVHLDQYMDKDDLVNAINQIPYYPGNKETDKALDLARLEGFLGERKDVPNVALVITYGLSTRPDLTKYSADQLKSIGTTVFGIGIGSDTDTSELNYISSDPDSSFVFFAANFTDLSKIEQSVAKTTCEVPLLPPTIPPPLPTTRRMATPSPGPATPAPSALSSTASTDVPPTSATQATMPVTTPQSCTTKEADVVYLVDSSGSVGIANFDIMKQFVKDTVGALDIGTFYIRVGLITFSSQAILEFGLNEYNTTAELDQAIDNIAYAADGTNTAVALEMLRHGAFTNERPDVPNIAVVITDGFSRDEMATRQQAKLAKQQGITLIAIGIGNGTDFSELTDIASLDNNTQQSLVYQVGDFSALQSLNEVVAHVACGVAISGVHLTTSIPTEPSNVTKPDCFDSVDNCVKYGSDICYDYRPWAMAHCSKHCGFCAGGPTTTLAPCSDVLPNCYSYGTYICTEVSLSAWTKNNCRKYCGFCGGGGAPTDPPATTTPMPTEPSCSNKLNNCDEYGGKAMCTDKSYEAWAKNNCFEYCGYCTKVHMETGATLSNNQTCPDWILPNECTLVSISGSCCPLPQCPQGYMLTVKTPNEIN